MALTIAKGKCTLSKSKCHQLWPCFLFVDDEAMEKALEATTQHGKIVSLGHIIRNKFKSPHPANDASHHHELIATQTVFAVELAL